MRLLFFDRALLGGGSAGEAAGGESTRWAEQVLVTVDAIGIITAVEEGAVCPPQAERWSGVALPGIANLHSHAHQRAIAGLGESSGEGTDSFWSWRDAMYRAVRRMDPDAFQAVAAWLYVEMLKAGYTAVGEFHYLHHDFDGTPYADPAEMSHRCVAAAREAGLPITLLPVLYNTSGFGATPPTDGQKRFIHQGDAFVGLMQRLTAAYAGDADVRLGIAPHSLRAVPPDLLAAVLPEIDRLLPGSPVHIHIAEQVKEVEDCLAHTGQRPVEWLLDHAPVDDRWCLIHATHVMPSEVIGMARSGAVVGLCLTTEANLGDGLFPADHYLAAGGRFGVGSDSHISVSPVEELRWLEYGARLMSRRRTVLAGGPLRSTGRRLFDDARRGGAQACGLSSGQISVGYRADIITLESGSPVLAACTGDSLLDGWVFSGNVPMVKDVLIAGQAVVRDGHHPHEDSLRRRYRHTLERLFQ